jgi:hypothetical protein
MRTAFVIDCRCVLLAVALIMISLSYDEVYARGNRESRSPELTVISEDGTLVNANTRVIATGSVSVVGNDPFTRLVLRTTAPDSSDRWILEIQGPLSEEIGRFYQHTLITITGTLLSLPSGAMNGAIEVASFETIDSP